MIIVIKYIAIAFLLLLAELAYFSIADRFNIIDKPNERSSHSTIVLRGGGIIFPISMLVWAGLMMIQGGGAYRSGVSAVSHWLDIDRSGEFH